MSNFGGDFPALYEFSTEARHSLRDTECFLVGRNPAANLILLDVTCSRQQFRIVRRGGQFVLEPLSRLSRPGVTARWQVADGASARDAD